MKKETKEYSKISELKRKISEFIDLGNKSKLSEELIYTRGFGFNKYKIVISIVEEDYIIDQAGVKWMRVKEEK